MYLYRNGSNKCLFIEYMLVVLILVSRVFTDLTEAGNRHFYFDNKRANVCVPTLLY